MKTAALVILFLLAACKQPVVDQTYNGPEMVPMPWSGEDPPYAVRPAPDLDEDALAALQEAMDRLNEIAGFELFIPAVPGYHAVVQMKLKSDPLYAGHTGCEGQTCTMNIDPDWIYSPELYMHELVHTLGYSAEDGDIHDKTGLMADTIGSAAITPRVQHYVGLFKNLLLVPKSALTQR